MFGFFADWIIDIFNGIYSSQSVFNVFSTYNKKFTELMQNPVFKSISTLIMSISMSVLIIYFFMDLAEKATAKTWNFEFLVRSFLHLFISFFIITNCMTFVQLFVDIGTDLASKITVANTGADFFNDKNNVIALKNGLGKFGIKDSIAYIVKIILPYLLMFASELVTIFVAVSRVVELAIRAIFAPIAVADCFQEGSRSNGVRYLKKIAALALQFALMVMICVCVSLLIQQTMGVDNLSEMTDLLGSAASSGNASYFKKTNCKDFLDAVLGHKHYWTCLGLIATRVGLLVKSMGLANDIVGV